MTNSYSKVDEEITSDGHSSGIELEEESDDSRGLEIIKPFNPADIDIKTRPITIDLLMRRIKHKEIDLMPDFQRKGGIWKPGAKSRLIESLMLRIPLPVFYIAADDDDNWVVVDGLQRISTLYDYINNKAFSLVELEYLHQFIGTRFPELPRSMQRRIEETELVIHLIQPGTPREVTRTIFKRINTGGLPLSPQEIRHALYQGKATKLLKSLADSIEFRKATDYSIKDDRMGDRECILRCLAFYHFGHSRYRSKDLDGFLCNAMTTINDMSDDQIEVMRRSFLKAMSAATRIFDRYAFRKLYSVNSSYRFPINKALFESWSSVLCKATSEDIAYLSSNKDVIRKKFVDLMKGDFFPTSFPRNLLERKLTFENAISQDTSEVNKVSTRFYAIEGLVEDVLRGGE